MFRIGKEEGVKGLWRGTGAALLREASYSSIRMGLYEPLKHVSSGESLRYCFGPIGGEKAEACLLRNYSPNFDQWAQAWTDDPAHSPLWIKVAAGALSGTIGSAIANPTDVVMIRMQAPVVGTTMPGILLFTLGALQCYVFLVLSLLIHNLYADKFCRCGML